MNDPSPESLPPAPSLIREEAQRHGLTRPDLLREAREAREDYAADPETRAWVDGDLVDADVTSE